MFFVDCCNKVNMATSASAENRLISTPSGGHVEFQVEGTGPAILMIPSLGRGASDFDDRSRRLVAARFTAVCLEPRGIGKAAGPINNIIGDGRPSRRRIA
jgi:hypothetical protein